MYVSTGLYIIYKRTPLYIMFIINLQQHPTWWPSLLSPCHFPCSSINSEGKKHWINLVTAITSMLIVGLCYSSPHLCLCLSLSEMILLSPGSRCLQTKTKSLTTLFQSTLSDTAHLKICLHRLRRKKPHRIITITDNEWQRKASNLSCWFRLR